MSQENNWNQNMRKLHDHPSQMDINLAWDSLENRLEKKKKRRLVFWIWPIIGVMTFALLYYINGQQTNTVTTLPKMEKPQTSDKEMANNNNNINENKATQVTHLDKVNRDDFNIISSKKLAQAYNNVKKNGPISHEFGAQNVDLIASNSHNQMILDEVEFQKEVNIALDESHRVTNTKVGIDPIENLDLINRIDSKETPFLENYIHPKQTEDRALSMIYPNINYRKNSPSWVEIGTNLGTSSFTYLTSNPESKGFVQAKSKAERPLENYGLKWKYCKEIMRGFYWKGGIQYVRSNEKMVRNFIDTVDQVLKNQVIETYTDNEGLISQIVGDKMIKNVIKTEQTRFNTIQQFSAIIGLGKMVNMGKHRFAMETTLAMPIFTQYEGSSPNMQGDLIPLASIYPKTLHLQYGISGAYVYPFSRKLDLQGGYSYTFQKLSTNFDYSRTQQTHSISLGIRYYYSIKN